MKNVQLLVLPYLTHFAPFPLLVLIIVLIIVDCTVFRWDQQ